MGAGDEDLVDVEDLRKGQGGAAEADFELAVALEEAGRSMVRARFRCG